MPVLNACLGMDGDQPLMVLGCISVGLLVLDRLLQSGGKLAQVLTLLAFCILDECIPADGHVENMRACCRYTRRRQERTHGGVLNVQTEAI